jgi:ATP-dependent Clp protease adaptor protein ClpS
MSKKQKKDNVKLIDKQEQKVEPPKKFKVVFYNDDYTPMEFVVLILRQVFHHPEDAATAIMLSVHNNGRGVAGVFSKEIAETKAHMANQTAANYGHPLRAEFEPE